MCLPNQLHKAWFFVKCKCSNSCSVPCDGLAMWRDVCHVSVLRLFCSILKIIGWLLKANLFQSIKICLNATIVHIFDEANESLHFIILTLHNGKVLLHYNLIELIDILLIWINMPKKKMYENWEQYLDWIRNT